ncbi:FAD-binding oxidoreductase [Petrotoga sp. 9PWA.NaAc.5.4]|uniref:NAD(P)/FAD-dependent oxidoreductase n=1 Tax=Petrotoga sp. 9PWA.NaAc.5.4 TaxID=1434328 RepID=UPI000CA77ADB|nr:FAD-dependent oxidoreductase [Petrotoga sp. 9PWA.NaAc.5.4]
MKNKASVVVIGGGVVGCSIAYNLAKKGITDVVLIEKSFLSSGATGRCGAGVRQQWGTKQNCLLARESIRIFENFKDILEINRDIELKQKGYLLLAYSENELKQFKKNIEIQHSLSIPSRLVTPQEAKEIVPGLNIDKLVGGAFCSTDGHANPFQVNIGYAEAAERLGVEINKFTEVKGIRVKNNSIIGVETNKGFIETSKVVDAAGGWSQQIAKWVGVELPIYSERHEILVTEPVKPMLDPMLMSFSFNIYCQQTPEGSFIMGYGPENEPPSYNMNSSWRFLETMAQKATFLLPSLKDIRIIRQWAGLYNMSPDKQPIVSKLNEVEGFYVACGFSGHGFMLAPAIGILMADIITESQLTYDVVLDIERFKRGEVIAEPSVV